MRKKKNVLVVNVCRILFTIFAFAYIYFFQGELLGAAHEFLSQGRTAGYNCLITSIVFTSLALLLELGVEKYLNFGGFVYACNYIPSAFLLGFVTRFDGTSLLGDSIAPVIWSLILSISVMFLCKVIQTGIMTERRDNMIPVASNLFIISCIMVSVPALGNTDENWHRALKIEHEINTGHPEKALMIGVDESESDRNIDMLRVKAMLMLDPDTLAVGDILANRLFHYSVSDRISLAKELRRIEQSDSVNQSNRLTLVSHLLNKNLDSFVTEIDVYSWQESIMPDYFIQAMVMADSLGMAMPDMSYVRAQAGYEEAVNEYSRFAQALRQVEEEPVKIRANSLFLDFHETYYWFYRFAR